MSIVKHVSIVLGTFWILAMARPIQLGKDFDLVKVDIAKVFIPPHYDDNDNVEITVTGTLPNTCYKLGKSGAAVDHQTKNILLTVEAYRAKKDACEQVEIPFSETVSLGLLEAGVYNVTWGGTKGLPTDPAQTHRMEITPGKKDAADDYLYAPVEIVDRSPEGTLELKGRFPNFLRGCMKVVEVLIAEEPGDVIVVQPVAGVFPDSECGSKMTSATDFTIKTGLHMDFDRETLIHVRVLNGRSLNKVYGNQSPKH